MGVDGDTSYNHAGHRYDEEQELGLAPGPAHPSAIRSPYQEYEGEAYAVRRDELERGRSRSRGPISKGGDLGDNSDSNRGLENPFADPTGSGSLRPVSPRPEPDTHGPGVR
jgi:hypothetical protein